MKSMCSGDRNEGAHSDPHSAAIWQSQHASRSATCGALRQQARPAVPRPVDPRSFLALPAMPLHVALCRAAPSLRRRTSPGLPSQSCRSAPDVPRQISPCQPRLSRPRLSLPAIPFSAEPSFLAMPAVRCRASIAPDLATPCLPTAPFNATPYHACQSEPVLQHLAMPAAPCHTRPSHALVTSPAMPRQRCPRGLARRALH